MVRETCMRDRPICPRVHNFNNNSLLEVRTSFTDQIVHKRGIGGGRRGKPTVTSTTPRVLHDIRPHEPRGQRVRIVP